MPTRESEGREERDRQTDREKERETDRRRERERDGERGHTKNVASISDSSTLTPI